MKKLVLALLIALGAANTNVVANITTQQVTDAIASSDVSEKKSVLEWIKEHPYVTTGIILTAVSATGYAVDRFALKSRFSNQAGTYVKGKYDAVKDYDYKAAPGKAWTYCTGTTKAKAISALTLASLAVVVYAIYDLRKDKADSNIKTLYNKLFGKKEAVATQS